jgi:ribonuclease P protein component
MKQNTLTKEKRLISNLQFKYVLVNGHCFHNKVLTLYMAENKCGHVRLGVSVGKTNGNAVKRNRLKRLIREVFRKHQEQIPNNYDYLVMIKKGVKQTTFEQIKSSFLTLVISAKKVSDEN